MKIQTLIFCFLIATGGFAMDRDTLLLGFMPDESPRWTVESDKIFTTDFELYDYINGGAELYLNYGFRKLARRTYILPDSNRVNAEIFDMGVPKNAYGVFSYAKHKKNAEVGQGAQHIGGSLIFWQKRYYVSVSAQHETQEIADEVLRIGRSISKAIGDTAALPPVFYSIPENDLVEGSTFYFHHHAWQNKFRFISNDNIFNINENVKALLAQYGKKQQRYYLLVLAYPDKNTAIRMLKESSPLLAKGLKKKKVVQNEKGQWIGVRQNEHLLMYVFDAPSKDKVEYLVERTLEKYLQHK